MTDTQIERTPEEIAAVIAKLEAEATAARADAALSAAAAGQHAAEAHEATVRGGLLQLGLDRETEKRGWELAMDSHHKVFNFDTDVSPASAKRCMDQFTRWTRQADGPIEVDLRIHSPGGSITDGLHLIDYLETLKSDGHTINTTAYGMAASMAAVMLQVGTVRRIGPSTMFLVHEAQFKAGGSFGDVKDTIELIEHLHTRLLTILAARSTMTVDDIKVKWERKDWWMPAQTAVDLGFADIII